MNCFGHETRSVMRFDRITQAENCRRDQRCESPSMLPRSVSIDLGRMIWWGWAVSFSKVDRFVLHTPSTSTWELSVGRSEASYPRLSVAVSDLMNPCPEILVSTCCVPTSLLTLHSPFLIPHPRSRPLTPHCLRLAPHSSPLTPRPPLPTPHYSLRTLTLDP